MDPPMHGGSLPSDVVPNFIHALRKESVVFDGRILGRLLSDWQETQRCVILAVVRDSCELE
jgi:hypothetical protein